MPAGLTGVVVVLVAAFALAPIACDGGLEAWVAVVVLAGAGSAWHAGRRRGALAAALAAATVLVAAALGFVVADFPVLCRLW